VTVRSDKEQHALDEVNRKLDQVLARLATTR
jgi:hypothetical protein